ncbi:MAG: DUF4041 domain-containing protein [Ardenticatenaceae bacterium]
MFKKMQQLKRFQGISELEAEKERIRKESERFTRNNQHLKQEESELNQLIGKLKAQVSDIEADLEYESFGLYRPKYDFHTSVKYKEEIAKIRKRQKQLIKDKKAAVCEAEWTVEGSKSKGKKMVNEYIKLMLLAFNGESDSLILKVKYSNVDKIQQRMYKSYESINKLGQSNRIHVTEEYLKAKKDELYLVYEYQEKLQAEREEQKQIRQRIREEQRIQKEIEKAQKEAHKEQDLYQKALAKARREMAKAKSEQQGKYQAEINKLNQLLKEAEEKNQRAISQAQLTKSGHVYVISNVGTFGKDIYKIGMTRRLEPMDRIKELSSASVPFKFDVHAMIYSSDAPGLENKLHKAFDHRRVNRVNRRKEFFNVSLREIEQVVRANYGHIEFTLVAEAEEYRKTQAMLAEQ